MTELECAQLLTAISAVDNRTVGVETVKMWHKSIGHLSADVALEAVHLHFKESTMYLVPAHVTAGARRVEERRLREARRSRPALEPARITLDRAELERMTLEAIERNRALKKPNSVDPISKEDF